MATDRLSLLIYRTLLLTTAAVALVAGIAAGLDAENVTPAYQLTEYWRAYGLLVFAALFVALAASPPGAAILWLVVLFHKASMAMTAVLLLRHGAEGAATAAVVDGAMVTVALIALGLRVPAARAISGRSGHLVVVPGGDPDPHRGGDGRAQLHRPTVEADRDSAQFDLPGAHRDLGVGS